MFHQSLGKRLMPGVELKASPAKLLQGTTCSARPASRREAEVMFKWLHATYPDLFARLDVPATQVYALDCTYSSRLPDERTALQGRVTSRHIWLCRASASGTPSATCTRTAAPLCGRPAGERKPVAWFTRVTTTRGWN
ncbi:phage/plasmid replication protein, II/X family [Pseudomonas aeruginosa]|nr:phage/plasmid replication protein, II/X family [Pseudomonas aeruginosa]